MCEIETFGRGTRSGPLPAAWAPTHRERTTMKASEEGKAAPAPLAPIEAKTVAEAIAALGRQGYTRWFRAVDGGLQVLEGGTLEASRTFAPEELIIRAFYRFEGVS